MTLIPKNQSNTETLKNGVDDIFEHSSDIGLIVSIYKHNYTKSAVDASFCIVLNPNILKEKVLKRFSY